MSATLNQDDIKLLRSVFATKPDLAAMEKHHDGKLAAMEKRQDTKYASKDDLKQFPTRLEVKQMIEASENSIIQAVTSVEVELRSRIGRLEDAVGISTAN